MVFFIVVIWLGAAVIGFMSALNKYKSIEEMIMAGIVWLCLGPLLMIIIIVFPACQKSYNAIWEILEKNK